MQNMTQADLIVAMKDKQNGVLTHSNGYCKESESLSIDMDNLQHLNYLGKETENSVLPKREGGSFRTSSELEHLKVVNHVVEVMETGGRDSPDNSILPNQLGTKGSNTLKSNEENKDKVLNRPECERLMAPSDCANCDEHELSGSGAQIITSKVFQGDSMYTDKSIMECEGAQLIVCCKYIDCQHVKDICVDMGEPPEEKDLIDKHTDNFVEPHVSKPSAYWTAETRRNKDYEFHIPDGLTSPAQSDFSDPSVDRCDSKEESTIISHVLSESEILQAGEVKENGPKAETFIHSSEKNVGNPIEEYMLVKEPLVTTMLPLQKFGTRSFLRSFMDSLNSQGEEVAKQSNETMQEKPTSPDRELQCEESNQNGADRRDMSDAACEKPWKAEDVSNHDYKIYTNPLVAHDEREEEYVVNTEFRNSGNPFLVTETQSSGKDGSTTEIHQETCLKDMEGQASYPFGVEVQSALVKGRTEVPTTIVNRKENFNPFALSKNEAPSITKNTQNIYRVPEESPKRSTNNPFDDCMVENAEIDKNCENIDQQPELVSKIDDATNPFSVSDIHSSSEVRTIQSSNEKPELSHKGNSYNSEIEGVGINKIEPGGLHNHARAPKNASFADPGEVGIGDTSFSAVSGRITYSGPIAFSGSTSLRSDSSTTSNRSFAFPVLQSEWNSSPVRMERADRRKQKGGWKYGIPCCKF